MRSCLDQVGLWACLWEIVLVVNWLGNLTECSQYHFGSWVPDFIREEGKLVGKSKQGCAASPLEGPSVHSHSSLASPLLELKARRRCQESLPIAQTDVMWTVVCSSSGFRIWQASSYTALLQTLILPGANLSPAPDLARWMTSYMKLINFSF